MLTTNFFTRKVFVAVSLFFFLLSVIALSINYTSPFNNRPLFSSLGSSILGIIPSVNLSSSVAGYFHASSTASPLSELDKKINFLTEELQYKLDNVIPNDSIEIVKTCNDAAKAKSCDTSGCLRLHLPKDLRSRVKQMVEPTHLQLSEDTQKLIQKMRNDFSGSYDTIIVTGASSNHYLESKALLYNLHHNVLPHLKNLSLVYYDLGLNKAQREEIAKICKCQVIPFPFQLFPSFFAKLSCFSWKPFIVSALIKRANLVFWMDTSLRFEKNPTKLKELLQLARDRGIALGANNHLITHHTVKSSFHFFGDEGCAYRQYSEGTGGILCAHNEPLTVEAILTPWAACALNDTCMCPYKQVPNGNIGVLLPCSGGKEYDIGNCHRFDQSAISIITRKLYQDRSHHILHRQMENNYLMVKRGDNWNPSMRFD